MVIEYFLRVFKRKIYFIPFLILGVIIVVIITTGNSRNRADENISGYSTNDINQLPSEPIPQSPKPSMTDIQNQTVTMKTNKGAITIELFNSTTPKTAENFSKLAKDGFYDGTKFHRVIEGFMIQGGDPLSKDDAMQDRWGTGGPGYKFADEIAATNKNNRGTISMANAGPNTNGSQFFINLVDNNFLDTKHTVFGRVTAGMDVVDAIAASKTTPNDRPIEAVVIQKIEVK